MTPYIRKRESSEHFVVKLIASAARDADKASNKAIYLHIEQSLSLESGVVLGGA